MAMMMNNVEGSCLCGAVAFTLQGEAEMFHFCHCKRCRRASGSAHAANIFTKPNAIQWSAGEEKVKRFDLPEAKYFSRAFCTECGGPVPYVGRTGKYLVIPAGSVHDDIAFSAQDNIFWASRACWYEEGRDSVKFEAYPSF